MSLTPSLAFIVAMPHPARHRVLLSVAGIVRLLNGELDDPAGYLAAFFTMPQPRRQTGEAPASNTDEP